MINRIPAWCWWTLFASTVAYWFFGGGDGNNPLRPVQPVMNEREIQEVMRNR